MSLTNDDVTAGTSVPAVVVVTEDCTVAYGPHLFNWKKGDVIEDNQPLIVHLLTTGAPVGLPKPKKKRGTQETADPASNQETNDDTDDSAE